MGRLFWKFFLSIWLAQVIAALCIGIVFWARGNDHARRNEGIDVGPPAQFVLDSAEVSFRYGGLPALRELLGKNHRERVFALDEQGQDLLGRTVEPGTLRHLKNLQQQNGGTGATRRVTTSDGAAWILYVARRPPPEFRGERPPGSEPPRGRPGPPSRPLFPVIPTVLTLLASLVSAVALAWHFSKPIRRLRSAFDAAASGNLAARVGTGMGRRHDELTELGRDFDRMAEQLQTLVEGQRRLLHDVSHELRSPLARLQVAIGLARQRPEKLDASLDRIERESARMNTLIGSLLTLSRIESGAAGTMDEEVNVGELVADIANDARFEARAANKDVILTVVDAPAIRGRAELLHSAIENVVRNAVHYTAAETCVEIIVVLAAKGDALLVTVRDHGPGVPEMELESIFRPFMQGANAASRPEGYGLGLAIARQVIAAHGGDIRASNADGGGLLVGIRLPLDTHNATGLL